MGWQIVLCGKYAARWEVVPKLDLAAVPVRGANTRKTLSGTTQRSTCVVVNGVARSQVMKVHSLKSLEAVGRERMLCMRQRLSRRISARCSKSAQ